MCGVSTIRSFSTSSGSSGSEEDGSGGYEGDEHFVEMMRPTGRFKQVTVLHYAKDIWASATSRMEKVRVPDLDRVNRRACNLRGRLGRKRSRTSATGRFHATIEKETTLKSLREYNETRLAVLASNIINPLRNACNVWPHLEEVHPFERALVNLSLEGGEADLVRTHKAVRALADKLENIYAGQNARMKKQATTRQRLEAAFGEAARAIQASYDKNSHVVDKLKEHSKVMRGLPLLHPNLPTVALVGAPNVGKSSIVRAISSGKPEVHNYPFTTRGVIVGHVLAPLRAKGRNSLQVTDTPGLLFRPDHARNTIEHFSLAVLTHFPPLVLVFVMDPTEHSGSSVAMQHELRRELKQRFQQHEWMDVITKTDIKAAEGWKWNMKDVLAGYEDGAQPLAISTHEEKNLGVLKRTFLNYSEDFFEGQFWDNVERLKRLQPQEDDDSPPTGPEGNIGGDDSDGQTM